MEFKNVKELLAQNFAKISKNNTLYETDIDKDYLWNLYLDSFPEGTNPIFRERREYDCSACRQFIRNIGGAVYIDENFTPHSIFEFDTHNTTFQPVMDALAKYVTSKPIIDIYLNESKTVGVDKNYEQGEGGKVYTWEHFFVELPKAMYAKKDQIPTMKAKIRDRKNVFKRSLDEISMDAIDTVLELIQSNTLYKGEEWARPITSLKDYKIRYMKKSDEQKDYYAWRVAHNVSDVIGKIRNQMMAESSIDPKRFSRVEEVTAEKFVNDILPGAKSLEVLLENRHAQNMVSLIAPANKDAKSMFKWDNGFSWAYAGNITDSDIRQNVKTAGGNVDGVLRFSIQWNDTGVHSPNDVDAHCFEPSGTRIYFGHKSSVYTGGNLDVDIQYPNRGVPAVENITFPDRHRMQFGKYEFWVHMYDNRGGKDGFRAEIEFDGNIYRYNYNKNLRHHDKVHVATVTLTSNGTFSIEHHLPTESATRDVWGLKTNNFMPVTVVMYSPNYWDDQHGIGHRHYFFMLKDCINPEQPNGFYNEFLDQNLDKHKRVFEALGSKLAVVDADDQLSGLGFSATKRNDLIVKVKGVTERVFKVKF